MVFWKFTVSSSVFHRSETEIKNVSRLLGTILIPTTHNRQHQTPNRQLQTHNSQPTTHNRDPYYKTNLKTSL